MQLLTSYTELKMTKRCWLAWTFSFIHDSCCQTAPLGLYSAALYVSVAVCRSCKEKDDFKYSVIFTGRDVTFDVW